MARFSSQHREQVSEAQPLLQLPRTTRHDPQPSMLRSPLPMRVILLRLVVGVLAPLLLVVAAYGAWNVQLHRSIADRNLQETVRSVSQRVDREMELAKTALSVLALSSRLRENDLAGFYAQAAAVAEPFNGWIVVGDQKLQQLVNTRLPYGEAPPKMSAPELSSRAFATGQPAFSGLFHSSVPEGPAVAVSFPVWRDGHVFYELRLTLLAERLGRLLEAQERAAGWTFMLTDAEGREIARAGSASGDIGRPSIDAWQQSSETDDSGLIEGAGDSGRQSVIAHSRSPLTGWVTVAIVPLHTLNDPVNRATLILAAGGVVSLLLAIMAALTIGRSISGPLQRLASGADALVRGEVPSAMRESVAEVADVRRALQEAGTVYRRQVETRLSLERERRARELAEYSRAEMEKRERKSRRLIDSNLIGIVIAEGERIVEANGVFLGMLGYDLAELQAGGIPLRRIARPEDPLLDGAAMRHLRDHGEIAPVERDLLRKDGGRVPVLIGAARIVAETTELSWVCFVIDLTPQKHAAASLKRSEERYRGLAEAISSVVWTADAGGAILHMHHWSQLTGQTAAQYAGKGWISVLHPDDRGPTSVKWKHAISNRLPIEIEYRVRNHNGRYRWYHARGVPVLNTDGSIREWIGVCFDIDDRKAAAVRQLLLMSELDHRVRNILATVHSMVSLTGSGAASKEEYAALLQGRISAMARTHGLLSRQGWSGATLIQIVTDELGRFIDTSGTIAIEGDPEFTLRPKDALDFALVIHELATNAARHGALSREGGRLRISWHVLHDTLTFNWAETGGPAVGRVSHRGFGARLMSNVFGPGAGRSATCNYIAAGLSCTLTMPVHGPFSLREKDGAAQAMQAPAGSAPAMPDGRVLIVEDEPLIAMELHRLLSQAGLEVSGPVGSLQQALELAEDQTLTGAIIDINLGFDTSYPVADRLLASGVPVIFVTGYAAEVIPERFAAQTLLRKPIDPQVLMATLRRELGGTSPASQEIRQQSAC